MNVSVVRPTITVVIALLFVGTGEAKAQVIDFETLPDGTPTFDGQVISNQYEQAFGVTFSLLDPATGQPIGNPVIAKTGPPLTAFEGCFDDDAPLQGQGLGQTFLTDDGILGPDPIDLLITYTNPVAQASGVLIDTDCRTNGGPPCEQWTITAKDSNGTFIDQVIIDAPVGLPNPSCTFPGAGPGDSLAIGFSFNSTTSLIAFVLIQYTGAATGVGIAFDNFSPETTAPPPSVSVSSSPSNKICRGESVQLLADVIGGSPPFTYQWQEETSPGVWSNLGTSSIQTVAPSTTTNFRVILTDANARQDTSMPFPLPVCGGDPDLNNDGVLDGLDIQLFVDALLAP